MSKMLVRTLALSLSLSVLGGCGSGGTEVVKPAGSPESSKSPQSSKAPEQKEPVKLVLWTNQNEPGDLYNQIVHAKYPYLTLETIRSPALQQLVSSNSSPDMIIYTMLTFQVQRELGLLYDLNPMIKQNKFDLNRINAGLIAQVQAHGKNGEMYGIPHFVNFHALYYNKDIFDRFGVGYPKDNMTWDEVLELAKKVTRSDGGVDYRGLDPENINRLGGFLMGIPYVDPKTEKPTVQQWKPAFELLQKVISIPGNKPEGKPAQYNNGPFIKDRNVAMFMSTNQFTALKDAQGLNWDMAAPPSYKEYPTAKSVPGGRALLITQTSTHKEDAFRVIETLLSDETQALLNRQGLTSTLTSKSVQAEFGKDLPYLAGKNLQAVFKQQIGWFPVSEYDADVQNIPFKHSLDLYDGTKDVNTVIREAEEEMTQIIQTKKATK